MDSLWMEGAPAEEADTGAANQVTVGSAAIVVNHTALRSVDESLAKLDACGTNDAGSTLRTVEQMRKLAANVPSSNFAVAPTGTTGTRVVLPVLTGLKQRC